MAFYEFINLNLWTLFFTMILPYTIVTAYLAILTLLMCYCIHRYLILFLYFKYKKTPFRVVPNSGELPSVTIQLPVYNEMYVIRRLLSTVAKLHYPKELLEIQVLDDSTDETSRIARDCVEKLRCEGYSITYLHRTERHGFKAGALQVGLRQAKGELIAVFDADFIPDREFLLQMVPYFVDPRVGMIQSRWGHINRNYSLLTHLQSIFLDAHFILEHTARNRSGRFFNFNGTAGIWRKECILSAGGWQHDTLTEDLDLSYRAQLKGWKFIFLPDVVTPAEVPVDVDSFMSQQHRWAKGGIETAKKLLPAIIKSSQSPWIKLESVYHLTSNVNYLFILLLSLLAYPALVIRIEMGWRSLLLFDLIFFLGSTFPVGLYYFFSQKEVQERYYHKILYLPLLMAFGIGLCVNNGKAVIEALLGVRSEFLRTPKYQIEDKADRWKHKKYRGYTRNITILIELALGAYFFSAILFALRFEVYASIPFLMLFCGGFFYVSLLSLFQKFSSVEIKSFAQFARKPRPGSLFKIIASFVVGAFLYFKQ